MKVIMACVSEGTESLPLLPTCAPEALCCIVQGFPSLKLLIRQFLADLSLGYFNHVLVWPKIMSGHPIIAILDQYSLGPHLTLCRLPITPLIHQSFASDYFSRLLDLRRKIWDQSTTFHSLCKIR
jgi:hypothetical protein